MRKQEKNKGKQKKRQQALKKAKALREAAGVLGTARRKPINVGQIRAKAEQGDPKSQCTLGVCYLNGRGVQADYSEAAAWFQKAAAGGIPEAMRELGSLLMEGCGVPKDEARARELFEQGARLGDPVCQFFLARCIAEGIGGAKDSEAACRLYEQAAECSVDEAASALMELRLQGPEDPEAFARALALLEKASEARDPWALRLYAQMLLDGRGVEADPVRAVELLKRATALHLRDNFGPSEDARLDASDGAWEDLVGAMARPDIPDAAQTEAREALEVACHVGISGALEAFGMACMHGFGTAQDFDKARRIFEKSAGQGSPLSRAMLGVLAFWGLGQNRDMKQGIELMKKAADDYSFMACAFLARICAKGDGGWPVDAGLAEHYRREAGACPDKFTWEKVLAEDAIMDGTAWLRLWR